MRRRASLWKRMMSLMLVVVLITGMVPVQVFAEEEQNITEQAAENGNGADAAEQDTSEEDTILTEAPEPAVTEAVTEMTEETEQEEITEGVSEPDLQMGESTEETNETTDETETAAETEMAADTESETEAESEAETETEPGLMTANLGDPIQISSSTNWFKVDENNPVLKTPADFAIGKQGTYEFSLSFKFTPADIPEIQRENVVAVFTIPAGFTVSKTPSIQDASFSVKGNADGTTTVTCIPKAVVTTALLGQISVRQNAEKLLSELPVSGGSYPFIMRVYAGYNTPDQVEAYTEQGEGRPVGMVDLQADTTDPKWTVTCDSNGVTWHPGEISIFEWGIYNGRGYAGWSGTSAASDATAVAATGDSRYFIDKKPFTLSFHKTEGYLLNNTAFHMMLPEMDRIFLSSGGGTWFTFTADTGETYTFRKVGFSDSDSNVYTIDGGKLASRAEGTVYQEPVTGLSWADLLYKAGTFTFKYNPRLYYNRLYEGDWNTTVYTAQDKSYVSYLTMADGTEQRTDGDSLIFSFKQGSEPIELSSSLDLRAGITGNNLTKIAQYKKSGDLYSDSELLYARMDFKHVEDFQIMDRFVLSYDYEEALTPVYLGDLRTSKQFGFTYRIFIKDATTGNLARIETLAAEEAYPSYAAQTIDGVTETVLDGSTVNEWTLAEANTEDNSLYVSRIEICKDEYEYNRIGAQRTNNEAQHWFTYQLRAYHNRLSDASDIPDEYQAHVKREVTSEQIQAQNGAPIAKDYIVLTLHQKDNLEMVKSSAGVQFAMEVNDHDITGCYREYLVKKYSDTMKYNVDDDENTIPFGNEKYDPVILELSGDAVTVTDRIQREDQRILAIVGPDDQYIDLTESVVDPEAYLTEISSQYNHDGREVTTYRSNHEDPQSFNVTGQLYKLDEICDALGIGYAKKVIVALDEVNDWTVTNDYVHVTMRTYLHNVKPGHMNYDGVIGQGGAADLPKELKMTVALYCRYSDYKNEVLDQQPAKDTNGGDRHHGTKNAAVYRTAKIVEGSIPTAISVVDHDYYVNPFSVLNDLRGTVIGTSADSQLPDDERVCNTLAQAGMAQAGEQGPIELTRIQISKPSGNPQMQYKSAEVDFEGTDSKLLSLTNTVSFDKPSWMQKWDFELEYTLSNGQAKTVSASALQKWSHPITAVDEPRCHFLIPDVDIENDVYLTSLKVKFPDEKNWGDNTKKWVSGCQENQYIPSVGLGVYQVRIPNAYPGTDVAVGSVEDQEQDNTFDKLNVKATVRFKNLFGEQKADYTAEGASNRIAVQKIEISKLGTLWYATLGATTVNQGEILKIKAPMEWTPTDRTKQLLQNEDVRVRPVYFYKIDPNFTYINGSAGIGDYGKDEGLSVVFIPAGTQAGQSGTDDYGILKVSYNEKPFDQLISANPDKEGYIDKYEWNRNSIVFQLRTRFNAEPIMASPVPGVWMDVQFDADRDGQGGNESRICVETVNDNNQLEDGAPLGDVFENIGAAKDTNGDGKAEMLYADLTKLKVKVNEQAVQGIAPYAIATQPYDESPEGVESRDLTAVENLFSERVYMAGNDAIATTDWEVFIPIMKRGETQKYHYKGADQLTDPCDFGVDFMGIDTSDLENKTLRYRVYYTTDTNPAAGGYQGAKAANWNMFKNNAGEPVNDLPDDCGQITMIKLTIDKIKPKDKVFFELQYKMQEHKSGVGVWTSQNVAYANFRIDELPELYFGEIGQSGKPLTYKLRDMELKGFVWNEEDYNSTYNAGVDTRFAGAEMKLFTKDGEEVAQKNSSDLASNKKYLSDRNGQYTLYLPHDGEWDVKAVLPEGKRLVIQKVNQDPLIDSAFDRKTGIAEAQFTANALKKQYTLENVNAGVYTAPVITLHPENALIHVTDSRAGTMTAEVANRAPGSRLTFALKEGEAEDIAVVNDRDNETADFDGLKTGVVKGVSSVFDGYDDVVTKDFTITVYANVKYDANTGTGTVTDDGKYYPTLTEEGEAADTDLVTAQPGTALAKTGYLFQNWNTMADGSGTTYEVEEEFHLRAVVEDLTLYAQWKPVEYQVVFDKNTVSENGLPLSGTVSGTMENQDMVYDTPENLTENTYAIEGYDFNGWNSSVDGTGTVYTDGQEVLNLSAVQGAQVTMYAQWTPHVYTITFDKNTVDSDGNELVGTPEGTTADKAMTFGKEDTLTPNGYTLTGYTFDGWKDEEGHTYTDAQTVINLTSEQEKILVFKAVWKINKYQLSYQYKADVPNQPALPETITLNYHSEVTIEPDAVLTGYDFSGWKVIIPEGMTVNDGVFHMPASDVVVEGSWKPHTYKIHFDRNTVDSEGKDLFGVPSGTMGDQEMVYDQEKQLTPNAYTLEGYTFAGWSLAQDRHEVAFEDEASVMNLTAEDQGEVTLYAVWTMCKPAVADPPVKKELTGHEPPREERFRFSLTAVSNTAEFEFMPMPAGANGEQTMEAEIMGAGSHEFGNITFTRPGIYIYRIAEIDTKAPGYKYDQTEYMVEYRVTQNGSNLEAARTITKNEQAAEDVIFTNYYAAAAKSEKLKVEKKIDKDQPEKAEDFVFTIEPQEETWPMPAGGTEITICGAGNAEFGEIEFTEAGTYIYVVTEKNTGGKDYTYDETQYQVVFEVTDRDASLEAACRITVDGKAAETMVFTNVYTKPAEQEMTEAPTVKPEEKDPQKPEKPEKEEKPAKTENTEGQTSVIPKTGDSTNIMIWVILLAAAGLTACGALLTVRKRKNMKNMK